MPKKPKVATTIENLRREKARLRKLKWRAATREHQREYYARYRKEHPKLKEYHANYYRTVGKAQNQQNKDKITEQKRLWRKNNPDKVKATNKAYRERNWEKVKARTKRYHEKHPEVRRKSNRKYRERNAVKIDKRIAKCRAAKPELYKSINVIQSAKRRARKKAAIIEKVSINNIVKRDANRCHLCLLAVSTKERSLDHLIPVSRIGAHAEWNLMLAHLSCNQRRGDKQILVMETKEYAEHYIATRFSEGIQIEN